VSLGLQGEDFTEIVKGVNPGQKLLVRSKSLKKKAESDGSEGDDDTSAS
jgi:HlyD family secretion protein